MTTGGTLTFNDGEFVDVSVNGVSLVAGTDYNTTTANTIGGLSALAANDQVEIVVYDTFSVFGGNVDGDFDINNGTLTVGTTTIDNNGDVKLADNDVLYLGSGLDLQIQHNGSGSFITDAGTGDLHIRTDTNLNIQNAAGSESKAVFATDGAVTLYHDNSAKLATSAAGIDVTGTVTSGGASLDGAVVINESSNDVDFRVESNNNTHALFVDASADKVGIGEDAPLGALHIRTSDASFTSPNTNADELILESNGNCGMSICSNTGSEGNINFVDSGDSNIGRIQYKHSDDTLRFRVNDAERYRIGSTGRMEMQTPTNENGVLQSCRIDWRNENNAGIMAGIGVVRTANANAPGAFVIRTSTDVDSASNNSDGEISEKFRVAANGDLTATDTSISSNSDQRLKENIADFEYDLTKFKQFQTRTFDWKQPHLHGDKSDVRGFVAQELEAVDSYWVQEIEIMSDSDDYQYLPDTDLQYGPNNNYKPDDAAETDIERTARFAKTSKLGQKDAMYVSVIQQLITKIETLETKVAALEAGE
tara:strand:+ start:1667 stop:3271 length:1605 start_codon:yes stop_codon:yes gene_type:complete